MLIKNMNTRQKVVAMANYVLEKTPNDGSEDAAKLRAIAEITLNNLEFDNIILAAHVVSFFNMTVGWDPRADWIAWWPIDADHATGIWGSSMEDAIANRYLDIHFPDGVIHARYLELKK